MQAERGSVPSLDWERRAWRAGKLVVVGVDEVGRGAWAGPLVAAAVAVPHEPAGRARLTRELKRAHVTVRDSKQLSAEQRHRIVDVVERLEIPTSIVEVPVAVIDRIGVGRANMQALRDAAASIYPAAEHVLVDAFSVADLPCSCDAIIHGDSASLSIALASVVAKTYRDQLMADLGEKWPDYGFALHKGYGTALHRHALIAHGPTRHHRSSFAPIAQMLADVVAD